MPRTMRWFVLVALSHAIAGVAAAQIGAEKGRPLQGPWFEVNAAVGMTFGGDEVPRPDIGLDAGDGLALSLGAAATPLWAGAVGVGFGLDFGFKYYSLQLPSGGWELRRFPLAASVHALVAVADHWFLSFAAGAQLELGVRVSRTGSAADDPTSYPAALGWLGEGGVFYAKGHVGADITLRYTRLSYEDEASAYEPDASSFGLFLGVHYLF